MKNYIYILLSYIDKQILKKNIASTKRSKKISKTILHQEYFASNNEEKLRMYLSLVGDTRVQNFQ